MRVKICGITNIKDALDAISLGADALGFVFYEPSPRYIEPKEVKRIIDTIPPFVERVGLFVNCSSEFVNRVYFETNISLAQIHFEADVAFYENLQPKYIKVVRAKSQSDIEKNVDEIRVVDAFVESFGGEGKRVNLDWFRGVDPSRIILAGGLSVDNLDEVKDFGFYGLDVSSGVEKSKGIKEYSKMRDFIRKSKYA